MDEQALIIPPDRRVVVVAAQDGEIVATASAAPTQGAELQAHTLLWGAGVTALPDQSVHIIEMPAEFFQLTSAREKHLWLSRHRIALYPTPHIVGLYVVGAAQ